MTNSTANRISLPRKLDAIVHIGAGHALDADEWLANGAARVVLAEADPLLASDLKRRYSSEPRVAVVAAAISGKTGPATLRLYNHSALNSLRASKRVFEQYPNLKLRETRKIDAIGVNDFIRGVSVKAGERNALVVTASGEEGAIITALSTNELIRSFTKIVVEIDREPLYEEQKSAEAIAEILAASGFDLQIANDGARRAVVSGDRNPQVEALAVKAAAREEALKAAAAESAQKTAAALDAARAENAHRNALLERELVRLEGQLELIKDVLIRDRLD